MSLYVVFTGLDGIERAREVKTYGEAGRVIFALREARLNGELKNAAELVKAKVTCLPLFVQAYESII